MRRLALLLCTVIAGSAVLAAGAATPKLSPGDVAAVRGLGAAAIRLTQQLTPGVRASLTELSSEYRTGCGAKYDGETTAHKQLIGMQVLVMGYIQAVKDGLPLYDGFAARVARTTVSSPLLRNAQKGAAIERTEGALFGKIHLDGVCSEIARLAGSGYKRTYSLDWLTRIERQVGADTALERKADRMIHASRPALAAAGLTQAQAKLLMDAETGDVFGVILGIQ